METEKSDDNIIFSGHISHFSSTIKHFLIVCPFHFLQTIDSILAPWIRMAVSMPSSLTGMWAAREQDQPQSLQSF